MLLCVASQLDTTKLEKTTRMFEAMDVDHNGQLSVHEFLQGLQHLGFDHDAVEAIVDSMDIDQSGYVDYSEFVAGCLDARSSVVGDALQHAFNVFDVNSDGVISLEELHTILSTEGATMAVLPDGQTLEEV